MPDRKKTLLVMHGPNLNLLGEREPEIYGGMTLRELNAEIRKHAAGLGIRVLFFQSNHEGSLIDCLHRNRKRIQGLVINAGALTHYSYALRDAIASICVPAVEVHLSDIHQREDFRKNSVIREVCLDQICGLGMKSYFEGINLLVRRLGKRDL